MPPQRKQPLHPSNKNIKDFFKPFTIPRNRRPANDTEEDEIVVASSPSKERRNDDGGEDITRSPGANKAGGLSAKHGRAGVKAVRRERIRVKDSEDAALSTRVEQSEAQVQVESSALSSLPADLSPLPEQKAPREQEQESSSALSSLLSQISPPKRREAPRDQAEASSSALSDLPSSLSPYKPVATPRAAGKLRASRTPQGESAALKSELPILSSPSSAAAKRRVLAAVVIPSSSPRPEAASPTPTPLPMTDGTQESTQKNPFEPAHPTTATLPSPSASAQQQQHQLTASFSSTATTSSSRRIRKNGIQGVTNSDSDSGASSSDDELAEASTFVPRKRLKLTPEHPVAPVFPSGKDRENAIEIASGGERDGRRRSSRRALGESSGAGNERLPSSVVEVKKKPKLKHSLAALVRQQQREAQSETRLRTLQAEFEAEELRRTAERSEDAAAAGLHSLGATASDGEDGERMKLAIQRTEAGEGEEEFICFRGIRSWVQNKPFPDLKAEDVGPCFSRLANQQWRVQAFLSGFVREITMRSGLPEKLRWWLAHQLFFEDSEGLREAYVAVLQAGLSAAQPKRSESEAVTSGQTDEKQLWNFYVLATPMTDHWWLGYVNDGPPQEDSSFDPTHRLHHFLAIIRTSTPDSAPQLAATLQQLIFAKLDTRIANHAGMKVMIDDTIESLLHSPAADSSFVLERPKGIQSALCKLNAAIKSSNVSLQLKCRAVASITALSERSHHMRRKLAFELLLRCERDEYEVLTDPVDYWSSTPRARTTPVTLMWDLAREENGRTLLLILDESPLFTLNEETDFITLNHIIRVLDIAIDAGFNPPSTESPTSASMIKRYPSATYGSPHTSPNTLIDAFITRIATLAGQIKDAGTTHLSRTLAKSALERLGKRLEYCVRSKPRKRQGVFGFDSGSIFGVREVGEMGVKESGGDKGMWRAFVSGEGIEMGGSVDRLAGALMD